MSCKVLRKNLKNQFINTSENYLEFLQEKTDFNKPYFQIDNLA